MHTSSSQSLRQVVAKTAALDLEQHHSILRLRIGISIVIVLETLTICAILFLGGLNLF